MCYPDNLPPTFLIGCMARVLNVALVWEDLVQGTRGEQSKRIKYGFPPAGQHVSEVQSPPQVITSEITSNWMLTTPHTSTHRSSPRRLKSIP